MYNFYKQLLWQPPRSIAKLLLIMKLTTLILITIILQVSATTRAQKITLSTSKAPLAQVFEQIRKQSGYDFLITTPMLNDARSVSISVRNVDLKDVLDQIFKDQPMQYTIDGMNVVVTPKDEPSLYERFKKYLAEITVRGRVVDESGQPLIGATVVIKGTKRAAVTDQYGLFEFKDVDESAFLQISFIGYASQELKVTTNMGDIQLKMASSQLEEVITKGYYATSKRLNTGNVGSVKGEDIAKQPVTDPVGAMMGRVAGVQIIQASGVPGRQFQVQIRGTNSIANGNAPLYVVDGVPINSVPLSSNSLVGTGGNPSVLNDLDVNSIEKIEVLKDADATSIYGSRGANGVVVITTKKGKAGDTEVGFNFYTGVSKITRRLEFLNTEAYLAMREKAFENDGLTPGEYDYDLNGAWDRNRYTDWQDLVIGNTAHTIDLQSFISGGNSHTQFRLGTGYHRETTIFAGENSAQKITAQASLNHVSENQKFRLSMNSSYSSNLNKLPGDNLLNAMYLPPNAPSVYDSNGNLNWQNSTWDNPFSGLLKRSKEITGNLLSSASASYEFIPGLKLSGNFGFNRQQLEQHLTEPFAAFNPVFTPTIESQAIRRRHNFGTNVQSNWIIEPQVSYSTNLWKGKLDVLAGGTFQERKGNAMGIFTLGYANDYLINNLVAAGIKDVYLDQQTQYRYNAIYGRVGYTLMDKYILNLTARRDGSSRFGPGRQFGNFGAVGVAWIFSKEANIADRSSWFSFGKIRASVGTTGNDQLMDYAYLDSYSVYSSSYQGLNGLVPSKLNNALYGWEKVTKLEAALETGFFHDRILFNFSYYRNRTGNQLVGYALPSITGFTSVQANLPAVIQNQGLELELNTLNIQSGTFSWNSSFNMTFPRNKLVSFPNLAGSSYSNSVFIGQPLNTLSYYHYTGRDATTGLFTFQDYNGDGEITEPTDMIPVFKGQKFYGGFANTFKYDNWQLDFLLTFAKQNGNNLFLQGQPGLFGSNQISTYLKDIDPETYSTRYDTDQYLSYRLLNKSDAGLTDASYIRLKNLALAYNFQKGLLKNSFLRSGKVYLQCQNLFTLTKFKGLDPELVKVSESSSIPALRTITMGVQFSF